MIYRMDLVKVASSNRTHRARHVKCGEERPACKNCASTGRRCDGYEIGFVVVNGDRENRRTVLPRSSTVALAPTNCRAISSFPVTLDDQEGHAFEFFSSRTSFHLPGYASVNLWERLVLQMSHVEPAMTSAIVAVGAMHHVRASALWNGNLADLDPARHEFALQQYSKSVAGLHKIIEDSHRDKSATVVIVLLACLMFIRFEMLQDCDDLVIQHLQRGLKILHEHLHDRLPQDNHKGTIILKLAPNTTLECLTKVFVRLDCDSTMLGVSEPLFSVSVDHNSLDGGFLIPASLQSLTEARFYLDTLANAIYCTQGELLRLAKDEIQIKMDVSSMDPDWYHCLAEAGSHVVDISANAALAARIHELEQSTAAWYSALARMPVPAAKKTITPG